MKKEIETDPRPDLPPEYCQYRDEGCDLAGSCLSCPFKRCVYDEPGGKHRMLKRVRDREIAEVFNAQRRGIGELAGMFGVSTRTVRRALKGKALSTAPEEFNKEMKND